LRLSTAQFVQTKFNLSKKLQILLKLVQQNFTYLANTFFYNTHVLFCTSVATQKSSFSTTIKSKKIPTISYNIFCQNLAILDENAVVITNQNLKMLPPYWRRQVALGNVQISYDSFLSNFKTHMTVF